jgi:hypothetical protein
MNGLTGTLLWVGAFVGLALAGLWVTKKFLKQIDVKSNADFLIATVTIVGTLVSVVLGLLVSSSVDQYRELDTAIDTEATSINDVFRLSRGLPAKSAGMLQQLCIDYCEQTIKDEWPAMKTKQPSESVTNTFIKLSDIVVTLKSDNPAEPVIQHSLLASLERLAHSRRQRIIAVQSDWMKQALPMLLACSSIVVVITYLYAQAKPSKLDALLVSFVAIALGSNIGLVFVLSAPIERNWDKPPEPFELNAKYMKQYKTVPVFHDQ